jgi:hypothetical protein
MRTIRSIVTFVGAVWLTGSIFSPALAQPAATTPAKSTAAETQSAPGPNTATPSNDEDCETCVFVMERVKKGTNMLAPSICSELYTQKPATYSACQQTLNALNAGGANVRNWLFEGCYQYGDNQSKEWVRPCPSKVQCGALMKPNKQPFCAAQTGSDSSRTAPKPPELQPW